MKIICLDTEFTGTANNNEILELSIFDGDGNELLHQLFRPERCRRWSFTEKIHGITPEMVQDKPHFRQFLPKLQQIFDDADLIVGFAIENDVKHLAKSGIKGLEEERCLDVRQLYWANRHETEEIGLFAVPNLVHCAGNCGFDWETAKAHCASADALATLKCYHVLMKEYLEKYDIPAVKEFMDDEHILLGIKALRELIEKAVYDHEKAGAAGYVYLWKQADLYRLDVRHTVMEPEAKERREAKGLTLVEEITVEDRWHAQYDFQKKFSRRWVKGGRSSALWRLNNKDVDYVKSYTNEFKGDSKLYKQLLENSDHF